MALSKGAAKLLAWLGLYKIKATEYNRRINGEYDYEYNHNWFIGQFSEARGVEPRITASPKKGAFAENLAELVSYNY